MCLIDDWISFCRNKGHFPDGHFSNLFREHHGSDEIAKIYSPFDQAELAGSRLEAFFAENVRRGYWMPDEKKRASGQEASQIASALKAEVMGLLSANNFNDLSREIGALPVSFVDDPEMVQETARRDDIAHADYVDFISDIVRKKYVIDSDFAFELKEALFQLTTNLDVTRYLMAPFTSIPDSFDSAYTFWKRDGVYCFAAKAFEVSVLRLA